MDKEGRIIFLIIKYLSVSGLVVTMSALLICIASGKPLTQPNAESAIHYILLSCVFYVVSSVILDNDRWQHDPQ